MKNGFIRGLGLVLFILLCLGAGGVGGFFTSLSVSDWYPTLTKPSWNPPAWLFAPVWTALYLMMAVAAWLVWDKKRREATASLSLFTLQLLLNVAWPLVFFGLRSPGAALVVLLLLWVAVVLTTRAFWRINSWAGILLLPYLAWTSFAGVLNFALWRLNV